MNWQVEAEIIRELRESTAQSYSEWLDTQGLLKKPKKSDDRTHEELVRDFLNR